MTQSARKNSSCVLLISCPDRRGLVATIAEFIFKHNGNILHADEHSDDESGLFLMRMEFDPSELNVSLEEFGARFGKVAESFQMSWTLEDGTVRKRVVIMVSQHGHCLSDMLYRYEAGELDCEIPLIISNHEGTKRLAEFHNIPFFYFPVTKENKLEVEQKQIELIRAHGCDLIVLARYMQILSSRFVETFPNRIINIHHSFLPAFVGARPYLQAFKRGVKLIGATSHYVTEILDDGPIIEQAVVRVSHRDTVEDLVQKGRDLEKVVLSRAVRFQLQNRILMYGNKTVVFE